MPKLQEQELVVDNSLEEATEFAYYPLIETETKPLTTFTFFAITDTTSDKILEELVQNKLNRANFKTCKDYEEKQFPLLIAAIKNDVTFDHLQKLLCDDLISHIKAENSKFQVQSIWSSKLEVTAENHTAFHMLKIRLEQLILQLSDHTKDKHLKSKIINVLNDWNSFDKKLSFGKK